MNKIRKGQSKIATYLARMDAEREDFQSTAEAKSFLKGRYDWYMRPLRCKVGNHKEERIVDISFVGKTQVVYECVLCKKLRYEKSY